MYLTQGCPAARMQVAGHDHLLREYAYCTTLLSAVHTGQICDHAALVSLQVYSKICERVLFAWIER